MHKKPQASVEEVGNQNREDTHSSTTRQIRVTREIPETKPSTLHAAVSWLKHQGSKFIWDLRSKISRKSKLSLISQCEDIELAGVHVQELNEVPGTGGNDNHDTNVQMDLASEHSAIEMHREIPEMPSDRNLASSQQQDQLVVGKSNYIDDSYPKLATALSDSPQNSLVAEFVCNAVRHSNVAEAAACDIQATSDASVLQCNPASAAHSMSPPDSDSESDVTAASSNERGKLVCNTPPNTQNHAKKLPKKERKEKKKRKGRRNANSVSVSSQEVIGTNATTVTSFTKRDQNLRNNHELQHQEMLNNKYAQSDSNTLEH